jgi:hypothetical protein
MNMDISVVLETILGSALGAGATWVAIWLLFFKARVEHLQAISAPNLAKELQEVSKMLDQNAKEKKGLEQQINDLKKSVPETLGEILDELLAYSLLAGKAEGETLALTQLAETIQRYTVIMKTESESNISRFLMNQISSNVEVLTKSARETQSAGKLRAQNVRKLLAKFESK